MALQFWIERSFIKLIPSLDIGWCGGITIHFGFLVFNILISY